MIKLKKTTILIMSGIMAFSFVSCAKKADTIKTEPQKNADEINRKYEQIVSEINSDAESSYDGLSFSSEAFSSFDYSFFPPSDNTATHSLDKNTFGKVNLGGTYFNTIAPGNDVYMEAESFKTAKGLTILNTSAEFINAYAIEDGKALYKPADSTEYQVLSNSTFTGTLTAVYVSKGDGEFALIGEEGTRKFLGIRDQNAEGMYFDPMLVNEAFSEFESIAVLDLSVNDMDQIYEFSICRFEASDEHSFSH